jgi:hypothetical protein
MNKKLGKFLSLAVLGAATQTGWAIPTLQLDIAGGTFVGGDEETTISNGPVFTLEALVTSAYLGLDPSQTYFVSAAIVPKTSVPLTESFGSFTINGVLYDAAHGMVWGRPPVDGEQQGEIAPHGIFDTHYAEVAFSYTGSELISAYNVQDGSSASGTINRRTFAVDVSGLAAGYQVHFDLYNTEFIRKKRLNLEVIDEFAPFSHDAASGPRVVIPPPEEPPTHVPDSGATVALLGLAVAALGAGKRFLGSK